MSGGIEVAGGADGIEARTADLRGASALFAASGREMEALALEAFTLGRSVPLAITRLVAPAPSDRFEAAMTAALGGEHGLRSVAERLDGLARGLSFAASSYEDADLLPDALGGIVHAAVGRAEAPWDALCTLTRTGSPLETFGAVVHHEVDELATGVGVLTDLGGERAAVLAGQRSLDGRPVLRGKGADPQADAGGPPRSVTDLMAALEHRDHGEHGEIDVRRLTGPDGSTRWIVDVTGTKSWLPLPTSDITSLATNALAVTGASTSYEQGVLDAMSAAGIRPDDPVMLVGHSQGGMVAANAAILSAHTGRFRVTTVLTAGAPIGQVSGHVPASVQVLAMENAPDVVPHADGRDNARRPNVTTVTVHHDEGSVGGDHGIDTAYLPGAADVDRSTDPSVEAFLRHASPFLTATDVSTSVYVVKRGY